MVWVCYLGDVCLRIKYLQAICEGYFKALRSEVCSDKLVVVGIVWVSPSVLEGREVTESEWGIISLSKQVALIVHCHKVVAEGF